MCLWFSDFWVNFYQLPTHSEIFIYFNINISFKFFYNFAYHNIITKIADMDGMDYLS